MGHDTYAYMVKRMKIAYLRRSAFCDDNRTIYELLGAEENYAGVSGDGGTIEVDRYAVEKAIEEGIERNVDADIIEFLKSLEANLPEHDDYYTTLEVRFG